MANEQLLHAATKGQTDQVQRLLEEQGANAKAKDGIGCTCLHLASSLADNVDLITLLLDKGALVNDKDLYGCTPLRYACYKGSLSTARLLLEKGADPDNNAQDQNGSTPLHRACKKGHVSIALLLLEKGADSTIKNNKGMTAYEVASGSCSSRSLIINQMVLEEIVETWSMDPLTGKEKALEENVETLSMDALTSENEHEQQVKMVKPLSSDHNNSNVKCKDQLISIGLSITDELVTAVKVADMTMSTLAHHVVAVGTQDDKEKEEEPWTEIAVDEVNGMLKNDAATLLQEAPTPAAADVELILTEEKEEEPWTEIAVDEVNGMLKNDAATMLQEAPAPAAADVELILTELTMADEQLHHATRNGQVDQVRRLLEEEGANVMAKDCFGWTPLHRVSGIYRASSNARSVDIVTLLLDKGALINEKDQDGCTPLHHACFAGDVVVACVLLDKGAHINDPDHNGFTPLHSACHHGNASIAFLLLEKGVDLTIKDKQGRTAFDVAHLDCSSLELIIKNGNSVLTKQFNYFTSETEKLKKHIETLKREKTVLSQKNEVLMQENESWKTRHEEMNCKVESWKTQNDILKMQNESLQDQTVLLKTSLANLEHCVDKEEQLITEISTLHETAARHEQNDHEWLQVEHASFLQKPASFEDKEQQEQQPVKMHIQTQEQEIPSPCPIALVLRDVETPEVKLLDNKDPADDNGNRKDQVLVVDSSRDELVTTMVVADMTTTTITTLARHNVTVGNQDEEEPWTEIAHDDDDVDDADRQQHMSRLGVVKSEFAVLTQDQPTPDAVAAKVIFDATCARISKKKHNPRPTCHEMAEKKI